MSDLATLLQTGMAICRVGVDGREGLIGSLFLTGLVGSLSHCAGMCGPFVLAQVAGRMEAIPLERMSELRRLAGAALLPYHLGRATTYAGLGAAGASFAGILGGGAQFRWWAAGLLLLGALLLASMALPWTKGVAGSSDSGWAAVIGRMAKPLFRHPFGLRGWMLGLALGFIPCGLLYAALAAASAGGNAIAGAAAMLAFALGTLPMLVVIGAVGHAAMSRWREILMRLTPVMLILNALVLVAMAWQMLPS